MGCSTSKLDVEEAVQLCKDRKRFIKQALEQRTRFASGHIAYIQSLKRVSAALCEYVEGDEPRVFLLDSFITPPLTPVKKISSGFISISPKSIPPAQIELRSNSSLRVNYLRSGGNPAVSVEERPPSPETVRVEAYSPMHQYGYDGFFGMQQSPQSSSFFSYSPNNRPNITPPSPQNSQWDFFWNPFSSLDSYGYPNQSSLDQTTIEDEIRELRQVRKEEGIPELEEDEAEQEESESNARVRDGRAETHTHFSRQDVLVEDVHEDEEEETYSETDPVHEVGGLQSHGRTNIDISRAQMTGQIEVSKQEMAAADQKSKQETPGFTVYVNQRPTSMSELIKDLEDQFTVICNAANDVSILLEASSARNSTKSNELTAMKMLNPIALMRSASSRSSSSRFLINSSSSRDEGYESSSDMSEDSFMFSGSHYSTLDRLYAWEKKLYEEVRSGEKIRIAYEKKLQQLRNQDVKGENPSAVDKTRAAIRDLHTQIKVSVHSVEAVSKRIETLRDEELQPQLVELIQGLAKMWKLMAECHQSQKQTIDEAKLLLAGTPSKLNAKGHSSMPVADPHQLARSAANLERELKNWKTCFESWITSQRSYVHAIAGWLLRCVRCDTDMSKLPFSPRRTSGTLPIFGLCIQWSRFLDAIGEMPVLNGFDFFAAGMGSLYAQQLRNDSHKVPSGSKRFGTGSSDESGGNLEVVEFGQAEDIMTTEKLAEVAIKVLCARMSVAMSSLTEFAISSANGYTELIDQWDKTKQPQGQGTA